MRKRVKRFIPKSRNRREKMVPVSVVKEDRVIYIPWELFKEYEAGFKDLEGIRLKRLPF